MTTIGGFTFTDYEGLWLLTDETGRTVSTIIDVGEGVWRARTPEGSARTWTPGDIPAGVEDVPQWIAEQITAARTGAAPPADAPEPTFPTSP